MSDPFYHYHPTPAIRWVKRRNRVGASERILQQLFVSEFVGKPAEWRDVPVVEES